ncbi:zinc ribbon domain-containing protein [Micrococcus sp. HOU01]|uniref:zinc ribbon domain-containing protein n=1 Tax=Micrococcus sp. HOU01 TaxID=3101753 RepID=UPI002D786583|nr:zinc ribbon domain-containing protein [Micrococcus sp. HOU1]WRQ42641.1 zinc ribbon domain-containing protein [Micrococcus sp. HOU1]
MDGGHSEATRRRGRQHRYLLSGIAVCGVCGAPTRVGTQNTSTRRPFVAGQPPARYRVYECAGTPGSTGFHVSMHQEHLDRIVTDAVLARIREPDFRPPSARAGDEDGLERRALRLEIKSDRAWLDSVQSEATRSQRPDTLLRQQDIVLPKIRAAEKRIEDLEEPDPLVLGLKDARSTKNAWERMPLAQRRHVVRALLIPRILPIPAGERGRQGINLHRVDLRWL